METTYEPLIEDTVEIAAPPAQVWALVTDLPRMASWSPQVLRTVVRGPVRRGTRALNVNRDGWKVWPTRSEVVDFEPHRRFAFRVLENRSVWSFTLEPTAGGTRLTQRRETPHGISKVSNTLVGKVLGGQEAFTASLREGMRTTLERIRAEAESAAA